MSTPIKRYHVDDPMDNDYELIESSGGDIVLHTDHLASHAYDEAKERALFEAEFNTLELQGGLNSWTGRWEYDHPHVNSLWQGWLRCAKSRAKAAGWLE